MPSDQQRQPAVELKSKLKKRGFSVRRVWTKPNYKGSSELRYFHDYDKENARELANALGEQGLEVELIPTLRYSEKVQPRLYEVWLDPNALLPNPGGGP